MSNSVHHLHCVTNWRPRLCVQKQWNQNFLHTCWVYHAEKSGIFFFFTVAVSVICSVMSNSLRPPWTVAHQAPLSMGFSRQEYWSGLLCPPPGDLWNQGLNPDLLHCGQVIYHLSHQESPHLILYAIFLSAASQSDQNSPQFQSDDSLKCQNRLWR